MLVALGMPRAADDNDIDIHISSCGCAAVRTRSAGRNWSDARQSPDARCERIRVNDTQTILISVKTSITQ